MTALFIIFLVFFLLFAPREIYPWVIAGIIPVYVGLWWLITRPLPISDDWGWLGRLIIASAMILGILIIVVRFLISYASETSRFHSPLNWRPAQLSCLFVVIWGGSWLFSPKISQLLGAGATLILVFLVAAAATGMATFNRRHRARYATVAISLAVGLASVLWWPAVVAQAAERQAGNRPYCLLVAKGSEYKVASTMLDLTPLVMRSSEGERSAYNYHGQMHVDDNSSKNWSYMKRDFRNKAFDSHPPTCRRERKFARKLPWF